MTPVAIIGIGLSPQDLTSRHRQMIEAADILIGGGRLLDYFKDSHALKKKIDKNIAQVIQFIKDRMATQSIVVLASGDPLFFGIGSTLIKALGPENVAVYPNISSIAAAFARIKEPWGAVRVVSLHGRNTENELFKALVEENTVAVYTDPTKNPAWIAGRLIAENFVNYKMCVLESLGTEAERCNWYRLEQAADAVFSEPNLVILKSWHPQEDDTQLPHLGIPDHCYVHENGLITKSEIRAITLSKLQLRPDHVLWDLGAGSGSVSIEAALLVHRGKVLAVEKKPERVRQIEINKRRFGIKNLEVVEATLPDGLAHLPQPDRIFIGGGGRDLKKIIDASVAYLKPEGRVIINTVIIPNLTTAMEGLKALGCQTEMVQVQISRSQTMPWAERLQAQNPVWIISARRKADGARHKA
jgi:precorrin-6Y C5,15-methyltransferase (decarboxylating)